jgi:hypothetical protein
MNTEGVLHHKIKFNDRVYLVDDINELLAAQKKLIDGKQDKIPEGTYQNKLIAGTGVEIKQDGTINCVLSSSVSNICRIKYINEGLVDEATIVDVDVDHHVYYATATATERAFSFRGLSELAGDDACVIELWVKVQDPALFVRFEGEGLHFVGDTNYTVDEPGQTIYFIVRYFRGETLINKYFVG